MVDLYFYPFWSNKYYYKIDQRLGAVIGFGLGLAFGLLLVNLVDYLFKQAKKLKLKLAKKKLLQDSHTHKDKTTIRGGSTDAENLEVEKFVKICLHAFEGFFLVKDPILAAWIKIIMEKTAKGYVTVEFEMFLQAFLLKQRFNQDNIYISGVGGLVLSPSVDLGESLSKLNSLEQVYRLAMLTKEEFQKNFKLGSIISILITVIVRALKMTISTSLLAALLFMFYTINSYYAGSKQLISLACEQTIQRLPKLNELPYATIMYNPTSKIQMEDLNKTSYLIVEEKENSSGILVQVGDGQNIIVFKKGPPVYTINQQKDGAIELECKQCAKPIQTQKSSSSIRERYESRKLSKKGQVQTLNQLNNGHAEENNDDVQKIIEQQKLSSKIKNKNLYGDDEYY